MFGELVDELVGLPDAALDEVVREAELTRRAADARLAAATAIIDARQSYKADGHVSTRSYLKATLNCSGTTANRIRKRAALVDQHGAVGEAWLRGHIGTDQVDTLARAHSHPRAGHRFGEFEHLLLDHAEHLEHIDLERVVDRYIVLGDTDGAFDDQQFQEDERTASVTVTKGAVDVHASGGDPITAVEMKEIFERACEEEFEKDCAARRAEFGDDALSHPLPRTAKQRRFDALRQIFLAWVTAPADGITPEPLVNIVIDERTMGEVLERHGLIDGTDVLGLEDDPSDRDDGHHDEQISLLDRRCHTSTGVAIHPDVALAAMVRGHVRRVVVDSAGVIIDFGRSRRLFTGKAREAAQLLAVSCSHRGCDIPARFCDVDHLDEWVAHAGPTDQRNGAPMCGHHDRFKHERRLRARRAADGCIRLIRPDGSVVKPVGERDPEWAEPPPSTSWPRPPDDFFARPSPN